MTILSYADKALILDLFYVMGASGNIQVGRRSCYRVTFVKISKFTDTTL